MATRGWIHRPVGVLMLLVTLGVIGAIAFTRIPLQLFPPGFVDATISLRVPVEESTPEEILEQVTKPVEESLRTIAGITSIQSTSGTSSASLQVKYSNDVDGDTIYADVRDRMERILPSLPEGADRYRIFRFNLDTDVPVMWAAATRDATVKYPDALLENVVKAKLEAVPGVARVEVRGLVARRVDIELDPEQVKAYRVDVNRLIQRLRADNLVSPGGVLREGGNRYLLRLSSQFEDFEQIRNYRVSDSLVLGDIATVDYRRALENFLVRVDGEISYMLEISKQSEANTVETCEQLQKVFDELPADPRLRGFKFFPYMSQGKLIKASLSSLGSTCLWGGLFAVVILYLFLRRVRITFVVAMAIPLSLLIAVVVIFFRGGTFNVMSLTGLTLAIGMLIDNAIVIAENIDRLRQRGLSPRAAATEGTREMGLAVTLATLTTVAVFLPLIFLGGDSQLRVILGELGLPVCYSLIASLFVALVFIPLATVYLSSDAPREERAARESFFGRAYPAALRWVLQHRFAGFLIALTMLGLGNIPAQQMGQEGQDRRVSDVNLSVSCPPYFSLRETDEVMQRLYQVSKPLYDELNIDVSAAWYSGRGGTLAYFLKPGSQTTRAEFLEKLKPSLPRIPGVTIRLGLGDEENADRSEVSIFAFGRDPLVLGGLLDELEEKLRPVPGILDVTSGNEQGARDEIQVDLQRELAQRYDVSPNSVSMLVAWALRGAPLSDFETDDEELPFWIQYAGSEMENVGDLYSVEVFSSSGASVSLANLARFRVGKALPSIYRRDGRVRQRIQVTTEKDIRPAVLHNYIQAVFAEMDVPEGYELRIRPSEDESEFASLFSALWLGVILIFVIMGVLFESFWLSFSAMTSLLFVHTGSFWAMYLFDEPFTPTSGIGLVILIGIVVNNAIVLVDCINRARWSRGVGWLLWVRAASETPTLGMHDVTSIGDEHFGRTAAIVAAGQARLRPIVMTACTTICGLLPLVVLPYSGQGLDYRPLAVVVLGGLTVATVVTLLFVPLAYSVFDDFRSALIRGLFRRR